MNTRTAKRSIKYLLIAMAAIILAPLSTAFAQENTAGKKVYEVGDVNLPGSRVYIHVDKTGLGHEHAVEGRLSSGTLKLNESQGELVFAMNTFTADTNNARKYIGLSGATDPGTQKKVNANMLGSDVLNVNRFPTATFKVMKVTPLQQKSRRGLPQYQIDGQFTLHGKTRPIRFVADTESQKGWLHVRGAFSILQTDYGMTPFSTALGAIGVADKLTIWGDLWVAEQKQVQVSKSNNGSTN